ncbi:unnamed protein product [Meganyctiphanes norvegica]|uniref:Uncharacterized protein n=1 Tax=Meganyctiphanes norvegica TaxID=48144 RepID=A0AAV2PUG1_MEGNR
MRQKLQNVPWSSPEKLNSYGKKNGQNRLKTDEALGFLAGCAILGVLLAVKCLNFFLHRRHYLSPIFIFLTLEFMFLWHNEYFRNIFHILCICEKKLMSQNWKVDIRTINLMPQHLIFEQK